MNKLAKTYWLMRALGWDNLPRRLWDLAQMRMGVLRHRLPGEELSPSELADHIRQPSDDAGQRDAWRRRAGTFFSADSLAPVSAALRRIISDELWRDQVASAVDRLPRGEMLLFSRHWAQVGWPVRFNYDPIGGIDWPVNRHWTTYRQFDPCFKDIKCVWEASRFATAFALARHALRSGDAAAGELFWQLFDDWDRQNPYGLTAQWANSQENVLRLMAWLFAACALVNVGTGHEKHYRRLTELAWYTARHADGDINYARGQKNNHAITEAAGLLTVAILFPQFKESSRWLHRGTTILASECRRQIDDDGSYVQHSLNYHRLILDDLLWACRLARASRTPLPPAVTDGLARATHWLLEMLDPSGRVPNYGGNDGANILPLSCCPYGDYRPTAQAAYFFLHGKRCFPPGPWDEKMLWLFGPASLESPLAPPPRQAAFEAPSGGYYVLRGPASWAMTRCHTYRDRPAQADMLHVDLWYAGCNILRDGGTYMYYCPQSRTWEKYLPSTAAHNTVQVDAQDQMIQGPRFLWFRWTKAKLLRWAASADGRVGFFQGEHYGYRRLAGDVIHRRSICRMDDVYIIIDDVQGTGTHDLALRWRLPALDWRQDAAGWGTQLAGLPLRITVSAAKGSADFSQRLLTGVESPAPEGWESLHYAEKTPSPTLVLQGKTPLPCRLFTVIAAGPTAPTVALEDPGSATQPVTIRGADAALLAVAQQLSDNLITAAR